MSRSITDICNIGVGMVGGKRIASLTEDSENARLCSTFYEPTVDEVLCMHKWSCAKHTKTVSSDADFDADDFDYSYAYRYELPSNPYCLMVRKFNDGETEYDIQGRYLYTDASTCELEYTKRVTDTNEFTPLLAEAISTDLGIKLSFPLQMENRLRIELIEYLEKVVLPRAKARDGAEKYVAPAKHNVRDAGR